LHISSLIIQLLLTASLPAGVNEPAR
jgi:hypothetical protein